MKTIWRPIAMFSLAAVIIVATTYTPKNEMPSQEDQKLQQESDKLVVFERPVIESDIKKSTWVLPNGQEVQTPDNADCNIIVDEDGNFNRTECWLR